MINAIEWVRGITARKSVSMDSLASSIQCTSSTTKTAGSLRANAAALISAVNRRRRASGSILGSSTSGSAMPSRSSKQQQVLGLGVGSPGPYLRASRRAVQITHAAGRPQQPRHHLERDVAGVRFAEGAEHLDTAGGCHRGDLSDQTALADARRPHHADHRAAAIDRALQQALDGGHFPAPTDQIRLSTPDRAAPFRHAQQPPSAHRLIGALDVDHAQASPSTTAPSTSRAVDALSITPPDGATDSIRCAIPTCSPIAV